MLQSLRQKAAFGTALVRGGQLRPIVDALRTVVWSTTNSYGLKRDLTVPFIAPDAAIPLTIRRANDADIDLLFALDAPGIPDAERGDRRDRRTLINDGMRTNYVAVDPDGVPCFFQSVLTAADNAFIARGFKGSFPMLDSHQALLEGAFTPEAFRGQKIMPAAMARITEATASDTIREAITFVTIDNVPSMKGCLRSGFHPYCSRTVHRRFFRQSTVFAPLPSGPVIPGLPTA